MILFSGMAQKDVFMMPASSVAPSGPERGRIVSLVHTRKESSSMVTCDEKATRSSSGAWWCSPPSHVAVTASLLL